MLGSFTMESRTLITAMQIYEIYVIKAIENLFPVFA